MAVTITQVRGVGSPVPATIHVEGTATICERVVVVTSCSDLKAILDPPVGGAAAWDWAVDFPNDNGCSCGQTDVEVLATCEVGQQGADAWVGTLVCTPPPPHDCWDDVTLTVPSPVPCGQAATPVGPLQFTATVTPLAPVYMGPFQWQVTDMGPMPPVPLLPYTAGSSTFSYTFPGPGNYRVRVKIAQPGCLEGDLIDADTITIPTCTPCAVSVSGPAETPCTDGPATASQTYTATTSTPYTGTYTWEVRKGNDPPVQSTGGSTLTFQFPGPGTYTVTVSIATQGCANPTAADSITVTVPPCTPTPPDTPPTTTPTTPPTTTTTSPWCSVLLVLAIVLLLLGALVVIVGVCINVFWVWIVGAAIGVVGLVLFLLWLFLCAALTPCSLILTMYCLLDWWVKVVAPVIVIVAAIIGGVPCGLAAAGAWAGWGALLSWYTTVMFRVGCPPIDCTARRSP